MVMQDKEHSGAWRCSNFQCDGYSEYSPDCNGIAGVHSKLCHTCGYGKSCKHCMNVNDCKDAAENIKKQEENHIDNKSKKIFYKCDPVKNKLCKKNSCVHNKNSILKVCDRTSHIEFSTDGVPLEEKKEEQEAAGE